MKNTFKLFGIIALAAIIGLSMMGCDTEGDDPLPVTVTSNSIRTTNANVYDLDNDMALLTNSSRDLNLNAIGETWLSDVFASFTARIQNGKLSLDFGVPGTAGLRVLKGDSGWNLGEIVKGANAETVKGFMLEDLYEDGKLGRVYLVDSALAKKVWYFYVDQAVTLDGTLGWWTFNNVSLQPGWNMVHMEFDSGYIFTNATIDSTYKWIIFEAL